MPTYVHSIAISSENFQQLRTLLDQYRTDHPWIIKHHGVGFLGHSYQVFATRDISEVFRQAGFLCRVRQW